MNAPRWVTPRRLGAAAAVYGVFVAGWYLGQPVAPDCHMDQAALDRITDEYAPSPSPTPALDVSRTGVAQSRLTLGFTTYAVACTNDTGERPRLRAWLEGG